MEGEARDVVFCLVEPLTVSLSSVRPKKNKIKL